MTRGKHGASAAARKLIGERDQEIAAYQHNIRKLTAENAELRQKLADQQASHSKTVRVLKAERDEGLSPQLRVLQQENVAMKERADKAQRELKRIADMWTNAGERMIGHFMKAHGLTSRQGIEEFARLCGGVTTFQVPLVGEEGAEERQPVRIVDRDVVEERRLANIPGALDAIQRARGERR